jgi:hypothetical protein
VQPLTLGDYADEMKDMTLFVWVNPPRALRTARAEMLAELSGMIRAVSSEAKAKAPAGKGLLAGALAYFKKDAQPKGYAQVQMKLHGWLAEILSQGEEQYTAQEIAEMADADIVLYEWILRRVIEMMEQFRAEKKKPSKPLSAD